MLKLNKTAKALLEYAKQHRGHFSITVKYRVGKSELGARELKAAQNLKKLGLAKCINISKFNSSLTTFSYQVIGG